MFLLYIIYQKKSPSFTVHNPGFYPFCLCPFSRNPSSCCVHFIGYILESAVSRQSASTSSRFLFVLCCFICIFLLLTYTYSCFVSRALFFARGTRANSAFCPSHISSGHTERARIYVSRITSCHEFWYTKTTRPAHKTLREKYAVTVFGCNQKAE